MKRSVRALTLLCLFVPSLLHAVTVTVQVNPSRCGQANGAVLAIPSGGLPPYTYSWSNGPTTPSITGLVAGDYTVTVTDGLSNTAQATGTVTDIPNLALPNPIVQRPDCQGSCSGWVSISEYDLLGTAPYVYDWPNPLLQPGQATFMGVCSWQPSTTINVTDATGCPGTFTVSAWDASMGQPNILSTTPACGGQANGTTIIEGPGGNAYFQVTPLAGGTVQNFELVDAPWTLTGLAAGTYQVWYWDPFGYPPFYGPGPVYCTGPAEFTIPSIPEPCGSVEGNVFHDADENCVFNGFDLALPYRVITVDPVGAYAITNGSGHYQRNLNYGNYDLSQTLPADETQICPAGTPIPVTIDAGNTNVTADLSNLSTAPHDLGVSLWSSSARPGFPTQVWISVHNGSAFPSGTVDIDLSFDALLANPSPATGQWNLGVIPPYGTALRVFHADVPANINLLGTVMNYTATVTNSASEVNTANNVATLDVTITGSYDPNYKEAHTSSGVGDLNEPYLYFPIYDDWIDYTVHFQNTGTAAAETVVLRDLIDANLSIPSIEILGASHAFTPSFSDSEPRELVLTFDNINLPDSTTDLLGSQGFFSYRIKPNADVAIGAVIENTAGIYFDFNPPIVTNTTQHVVSLTVGVNEPAAGTLRISPNPAGDVLNVVLPEGSGSALQVLSVDGRMVEVPTIRRSNGIQLDVRSLASGTYIARTATGTVRFLKY